MALEHAGNKFVASLADCQEAADRDSHETGRNEQLRINIENRFQAIL